MRILITGANGQLGTALQDVLAGHRLLCFDKPEFEVSVADAERQVREGHPEVVIHAAAYTDVDQAELEPERAMAVNAVGTERVARAAAACGARLIYVSTDYVFDGRKGTPYEESDTPNPLNLYGRSKLEGERLALRWCPQGLVVRTSWMYSARGRNFVTTIVRLAGERQELRVVADQQGSPTYAGDLAEAVALLLARDLRGVVHAAGTGECSWHAFACAIVAQLGSNIPVIPITTAEAKRVAARPPYSVLASRRLAEAGITLPHWKDALARCMMRNPMGQPD